MLRPLLSLFIVFYAVSLAAQPALKLAPTMAELPMETPDPYQWLEDIDSTAALDWARTNSARTLAPLRAHPDFKSWQTRAQSQLDQDNRLPLGAVRGEYVYNFWRDGKNPHGLWRRAPLQGYMRGAAVWQTLLDLDDLARREGEKWVWKGATCLGPDYTLCMVRLSRGGKDAAIEREFDLRKGWFVDKGFAVGEAKSSLAWVDENTLLIASDFGPGSLTQSGYPRQVRRWQRGTPLASAPLLFTAPATDVRATPVTSSTKEGVFVSVVRSMSFWENELHHLSADGTLVTSPLPKDAHIMPLFGGLQLAQLRSDWVYEGVSYPKGALIGYPIRPLTQLGRTRIRQIFMPGPGQSITDVRAARDVLYIAVLDQVKSRLFALREGQPQWDKREIPLPAAGTLTLVDGAEITNLLFATLESFALPPRLLAVGETSARSILSQPEQFPSASVQTTQYFATSADGTQVPYFITRPANAKGPLPTLLYGYGGFDVPILPGYLSPDNQFWLESGGAYVVANIRGGGEFGPDWHQAALKGHRQRAFDDFHAVAQDLVARGLTTAKKLAVSGRSNGGLLAATVITQRPKLYGAALICVPLTDMLRFHKLLAGASWIGEYGDPDKPEDRAWLARYSPYQAVKAGKNYPPVFFFTSTKDDRVHPGHARKMAAAMMALGYDVTYYENMEGGHAGSSNAEELAYRMALTTAFLDRTLKAKPRLTLRPN